MITRKTGVIGLLMLALFVGLSAWVYWTQDGAAPAVRMILDYRQAHPPNDLDLVVGLVTGFLAAVMLAAGVSLYESIRFERQYERGGGDDGNTGGSGGAPKRVRLPMSRKVVNIRDWQPPDGRFHRGFAEVTS